MQIARLLKHLSMPRWRASHFFSKSIVQKISEAVATGESHHSGEIRFAVEASLSLEHLRLGQSVRQRAIEVFGELSVWDTEGNCGILIYVLLAEHAVEIVADRGINKKVPQTVWDELCKKMEKQFAAGNYQAGACEAVASMSALLASHFPYQIDDKNELSDQALLL